MLPGNQVLAVRPNITFPQQNKLLRTSLADRRTLLRESTLAPTRCKELVIGWLDVFGIMDVSGEGVGGVIVRENTECVPEVYRMKWPDDVKKELETKNNPKRKLSISDFEIAGFLFLLLVMETFCAFVPGAHVALFSDNQPTVL